LTIPENFGRYYCCLNTAEQTAYVICAGNAGPITYFVLKTLFDAAFLLAIEGSASIRREIFVANNEMTLGRVPPEDPDGIEVYYLQPEYWDFINAWFDDNGTACGEPCKLRTFPL
jgi:hypothetical protein